MYSHLFQRELNIGKPTFEDISGELDNIRQIVTSYDSVEGCGGEIHYKQQYGRMNFRVSGIHINAMVAGNLGITVVSSEEKINNGLIEALEEYYR